MQSDDNQNKRCCIAHDNGQCIERSKIDDNDKIIENNIKENKILLKIKSVLNSTREIINKLAKDLVNKTKQSAEWICGGEQNTEINKKLVSGVVATVVVSVSVCVASAFFAPAYDVYLSGKKMGVVSKTEDFDALLLAANSTITSIASEYDIIHASPVYVFRIIPKLAFTPQEELKSHIISLSAAVSEGYTIVADGKPVVSLKDKAEAENVIHEAKSSYSASDAEIINQIEIVCEFLSVGNLTEKSKAVELLKPMVSVKTTEVVSYTKEIPYEVQNQQTEDLYKGDEKVIKPGTKGSQSVTAKVTKINGIETAADVLSTEDVSAPVTEVVMVGTKEKPNGIGSGSFIQPFYGTITSRFGARWGRTHKGIDIAGSIDSPIKAADNGEVVMATYKSDYGNIIILDHNNGFQTYYAHLNSIDVAVGDMVTSGQVIGKLGTTGNSTGPHLHFEVRKDGNPCDPGIYLENMR